MNNTCFWNLTVYSEFSQSINLPLTIQCKKQYLERLLSKSRECVYKMLSL